MVKRLVFALLLALPTLVSYAGITGTDPRPTRKGYQMTMR